MVPSSLLKRSMRVCLSALPVPCAPGASQCLHLQLLTKRWHWDASIKAMHSLSLFAYLLTKL